MCLKLKNAEFQWGNVFNVYSNSTHVIHVDELPRVLHLVHTMPVETQVCVCTDVGRTFSERAPAGSSVRGQACLGGVEMFSFTLPCSRWGTLVHFWGRACSGTARSGHRWDSVQCYGEEVEKTTGRVGCRLSDDRSSFGTANALSVHPDTSGAVRRGNFPTSPWAVILPRRLASMTPTCMKKQPLERERETETRIFGQASAWWL